MKIHIQTKLRTKYNLLTGYTATGKTTFYNILSEKSRGATDAACMDYLKNKWLAIGDLNALNEHLSADVVVLDENLATDLDSALCNKNDARHTRLVTALNNSPCKFIIINRGMSGLPIDYRSIYTLVNDHSILRVARMFTDFKEFNENLNIITEDSKTGFEYYQHWFSNVTSAFGKNNLKKFDEYSNQIVADGSAIGLNVSRLTKCRLYLPESFEYDLALHWKKDDTLRLMDIQPDASNSVEQYAEEVILPVLCKKYYLPTYKKCNKLHPELLNVQIHDEDSKLV